MNRDRLISLAIAITLGCCLLSYWVKPKAPRLELVQPQQELADYQAPYPGNTVLSERVTKSYALAMILMQSPYMQTNVTALDSIRRWARTQFQAQPDFLHPVTLPQVGENYDTVFGALGYNLFASFRYWLEAQTGELLRGQIARFHQTTAYESFNKAYFDFFGRDAETATLLARYESERAKQAVDVVLWSFVWVGLLLANSMALLKSSAAQFPTRLRAALSSVWTLLAIVYLSQAWANGAASTLLSFGIAASIAGYLWRPMALVSHAEARQRLVRIHLSYRTIVLACWFTFSVTAIQVLTWIRRATPVDSDPVTLLLSSVTGNFVHDPVQAKRIVATTVAGLWVLVSLWCLIQRKRGETPGLVADTSFDTLPSPELFERLQGEADRVK